MSNSIANQNLLEAARPRSFGELAQGENDLSIRLLKRIALSDSPERILLHGPMGVGKTSVARILARRWSCSDAIPSSPSPCNACEACSAPIGSRSPTGDMRYFEIDAASLKPEECADRIAFAARYRSCCEIGAAIRPIIFIDEAQRSHANIHSRLLKAIEDYNNATFILATMEAETGGDAGSVSVLFIDDVSVTVVPSPSGAAALGLAGVAGLRRRRRA